MESIFDVCGVFELFELIPDIEKTLDRCLKAIEDNPNNLKYINNGEIFYDNTIYLYRKICLKAISISPKSVKWINADFLSYETLIELYVFAIENGASLLDIPASLPLHQTDFIDIHDKTFRLWFVTYKHMKPKSKDAKELTLDLVPECYTSDSISWIDAVRRKFFTPNNRLKLFDMAIEANPVNLMHVPEKYKTYELCLKAIKKGGSLQHVPIKFRTRGLSVIAVKNFGGNITEVPREFITPGLCLMAIKTWGHAFLEIPKEFQTVRLFEIALQDSLFRRYFDTTMKDFNFWIIQLAYKNI